MTIPHNNPTVFSIPAGATFLEELAAGVQKWSENDPLALAQVKIYLPYRRAAEALRNIFLKQRKSLFLPQIDSLGELDLEEEMPGLGVSSLKRLPVIGSTLRQGLLTTLIRQKQEILAAQAGKQPPPLAVTLQLAQELIRLLDQAAIEQVPLDNLAILVPDHFATHWQVSLDFLQIISHHWPRVLAEKGVQDPYLAHHQGVQDLLDQWASSPPSQWIIAAGSTGTMPATAAFLKAVAHLPQGTVILPGLDSTLSPQEQANLSPTHPQYALNRLLKRLNLTPQDISSWPLLSPLSLKEEERAQARRTWFARAYAEYVSDPMPLHLESIARDGLTYVPCATPQEEALVIALILREALETPGKTAALITPDRRLTRRVVGELSRWGLIPKDTSGLPLNVTPTGTILRLIVKAVLEDFAPIPLLALLKHPLILGGKRAYLIQESVKILEKEALRGIRPGPGLSGIRETLSSTHPKWRLLNRGIAFLETALEPLKHLLEAPQVRFQDLLQTHLRCAEVLCTEALWAEEQGQALSHFFEQLQEGAGAFPSLRGTDYLDMLDILMGASTICLEAHTHPRLSILGALEARLIHADVMILGGLNEGIWPPNAQGDPWLSRPMREDLGLPALERRVGLASHDFGQAFAQQTVFLTRSLRIDGTPTVPSRILMRLETALKALGQVMPEDPKWISWAQQLDLPEIIAPCQPPAPCPPLMARPRRLSVTQVETWRRDPYALYARHILNLKPLEPLDADPDQADQGTLTHQILDTFLRLCPDLFGKEALLLLLEIGEKAFQPLMNRPAIRAFWWPRFTQVAQWFLEVERERRTALPPYKTFTEIQGKIIFQAPQGPFELTARADRLDIFEGDHVDLIDYKTGTLPTESDVLLGFSPQLPLEAALVQQRGFSAFSAQTPREMSFWRLCGGSKGGEIKTLKAASLQLAKEAWEGVQRLVDAFDHLEMPYLAQPFPDKGLTYNDYAHLARLLEWKGTREAEG